MIDSASWINLPVGYNLVDHVNVRIRHQFWKLAANLFSHPQTDVFITHPDVVFYDFYQAWTKPNATDRTAYLCEWK